MFTMNDDVRLVVNGEEIELLSIEIITDQDLNCCNVKLESYCPINEDYHYHVSIIKERIGASGFLGRALKHLASGGKR